MMIFVLYIEKANNVCFHFLTIDICVTDRVQVRVDRHEVQLASLPRCFRYSSQFTTT